MSDRKWIPYDFMDEAGPDPRDTPDEWIKKLDDGAPALDSDDIWGADEKMLLKAGEVVKFSACDDYGMANLTVQADGGFSVSFDMPPSAEQCAIMLGWQSETLAETPAESVRMAIEAGAEPDDDYLISYYTYSEPIELTFDGEKFTGWGSQA